MFRRAYAASKEEPLDKITVSRDPPEALVASDQKLDDWIR